MRPFFALSLALLTAPVAFAISSGDVCHHEIDLRGLLRTFTIRVIGIFLHTG